MKEGGKRTSDKIEKMGREGECADAVWHRPQAMGPPATEGATTARVAREMRTIFILGARRKGRLRRVLAGKVMVEGKEGERS